MTSVSSAFPAKSSNGACERLPRESGPVSDGLQKTLEFLTTARDEWAGPLLAAALDSPSEAIRDGALRTMLRRRSGSGQREILRRLHILGPRARRVLEEEQGSLALALRDAVLGPDLQTFVNACHEILRNHEFPSIGTLITALEDPAHPNPELAARTLAALCEQLYDELHRNHRALANPELLRIRSLESLEASVRRFGLHRRREVVESYLRLADRETAGLLEILGDPHNGAYLAVCDVLSRNQHPGILRLVVSFLDAPLPPSGALVILGRRADPEFLRTLLNQVAQHEWTPFERNVRRIEAFAWVYCDQGVLGTLSDAAQLAALRMVLASRMKRQQAFRLVAYLLCHGQLEARRAAARALADFAGAEANALAIEALGDVDAEVQSILIAQLRSRGVPGALQQLIDRLNSPHALVRAAARESLSEFSFDRYLSLYDSLTPETRVSTGDLVRRVDDEAAPRLREELRSPVRARRLRALAAAESLGLLAEVESAVVALLADSDGFTRAEAARRLARVDTPSARAALEVASVDATPMVKEAALQALAGQDGRKRELQSNASLDLGAPLDSQLPVEAAS